MATQSHKLQGRALLSGDQVGPGATPIGVQVETLTLILSDLAAMALSPDCDALAAHNAALTANLTTLQLICSACLEPRKEVKRQP
jgi:hypothetical protein